MEIQTFMLCKQIRKTGPGSEYDASMIGLHSFYSLDGLFPLTFDMPYFMLLRRPDRGAEKDSSLTFNLVDMSGITIGEPQNVKAVGKFPSGFIFMVLTGRISFAFPRIGDYRLDITADEETSPSVYHYTIEITPPPSR